MCLGIGGGGGLRPSVCLYLLLHACGWNVFLFVSWSRLLLHPSSSLCIPPTSTRVALAALQVLPVSDTSVRGTWRDSYPYSSLCVFALHPLYLRLQALSGGRLFSRGWCVRR